MTTISLHITAKRGLLERYFANEVEFAKIEAAPEEEVEINICSAAYIVDKAEKMIEENPQEHIYLETHAVDLYAYSGDYYYEQIDGEVKEWSDTSKVENVLDALGALD